MARWAATSAGSFFFEDQRVGVCFLAGVGFAGVFMSGFVEAGFASLPVVVLGCLMVCARVLGKYGRVVVLALLGSSCSGTRSALGVLMGEMNGLWSLLLASLSLRRFVGSGDDIVVTCMCDGCVTEARGRQEDAMGGRVVKSGSTSPKSQLLKRKDFFLFHISSQKQD